MRNSLFSTIFILLISNGLAQVDSTVTTDEHSPRRATLLSLALPGAGQVYNKKVWKVPIIYGGFAISAYYLDRNLDRIKLYRSDLKALEDDDPNTVPETNFSSSNLNTLLNRYKDLRDWSYVALGAIYALQVIDANVDAHLYDFDVGEDLSLTVLPYMEFSAQYSALSPRPFGKGVYLCLKF